MTGRAQAETLKTRVANEDYAERLAKAVAAYVENQQSDDSVEKHGARYFANIYEVSYRTVIRHAQDGTSIQDFNAAKQKLSPKEEDVLVNYILECASRGLPLTHGQLYEEASHMYHALKGPDAEPLGKNWVDRFLERHHKRVHTHWSKALDMQRAQALNPTNVKHWYEDIVQRHIVDKGIDPELIYAMDESGFPPSHQGTERVVGAKGTKTQHKQGGGDRENVTAVITICADGTKLVPSIIFKAKNFQTRWREDNVAGASFAHSPKGWTDREIAMGWLKDFDAQTAEKANGRTRVLLLDGHSSHYSLEFLEYARSRNIEVLAYPPHCTHALQGLDVVCFAKMKDTWKIEIAAFERQTKRKVTKADFAGLFGRAYLAAFTEDLVLAAFRATGIHPFNANVITPQQMKPSVSTSVTGSFPLEQPSPVRAIIASWRTVQPYLDEPEDASQALTRIEPSPTSPLAEGSGAAGEDEDVFMADVSAPRGSGLVLRNALVDDEDASANGQTSDVCCTCGQVSKKRMRNEDEDNHSRGGTSTNLSSLDPNLYTPSKRIRLMSTALAATSSGSFLVSRSLVKSSQKIPPPVLEHPPTEGGPDWTLLRQSTARRLQSMPRTELEDLARTLTMSLRAARIQIQVRDGIIEGTQAQLVLQFLYCEQLNRSLHTRETRTTKQKLTQLIFVDGKGRYLTDPELMETIRKTLDAKEKAQAEKEGKKVARDVKRKKKELLEARWAQAKEDHAKAVAAWEALRGQAREEGRPMSELPTKPTRRLKKDLVQEMAAEEGSDEEEEGPGDDEAEGSLDSDEE